MSNLLSQASLVMIPSGYKEDVVYSQIPTNGNGDLSFTRASNGTRVNSAGLVEDCPWNLLQYSEQIDNGVWTKFSPTSVTADTTTAPNGTTTADTISTSAVAVIRQSTTLNANEIYTYSIYVKKISYDFFGFQNLISGSGVKSVFDLSNGTVTSQGSGHTASIESVGNGWYRCSISFNPGSSASNIFDLAADGTSATLRTFYAWGAQLNIGSTAKPYFPTTDRLNVPRLTYQNGGGGCPSLLLEKQSTNYAIYSQDLTQSATSFSGGTVGANVTTSPDGTQNADSFTVNTATSSHAGYYETYNATNGQPFTTSVFLKAGTGRYFLLRAMTDNYATRYGATIDLQSGTILSTNTLGSPTGTSSKIENFGNGWYRVSLTINAIGSQMSYIWGTSNTATPSLDAYLDYSYTGNGTDSYYIWGMTLENSSYPTSYIPTTSSSATRVADACSKTGISSLIGQTEGTLFFEYPNFNSDYNEGLIGIDDGSGNNRILFYSDTNNRITAQVRTNGVTQQPASYSVSGNVKVAIAYNSTEFVFYVNGVLKFTGTAVVFSNTMSNLTYNHANLSGSITSQAILFKTRLTNAELASITTI